MEVIGTIQRTPSILQGKSSNMFSIQKLFIYLGWIPYTYGEDNFGRTKE